MINQLRFFLSQSPKPSPVNVYVGDAQFSLTAGELAEAMAVTQTQVNNNLTMTVFGAGKNVKEGAAIARTYVAGTLERWKEVI